MKINISSIIAAAAVAASLMLPTNIAFAAEEAPAVASTAASNTAMPKAVEWKITPGPVVKGELFLPKGTKLAAELKEELSTKTAKADTPVEFSLLQNIVINDRVIASRGAMVMAHISKSNSAAGFGASGNISIEVDYLVTDNGVKVPLLYQESRTRGNQDDAIGMALGNWIIGGLFVKGNDITIPAKTVLYAEVAEDSGLKVSAD